MISAFGVEHGGISKADSRTKNNVKGSAIAGGGAVAAGTGFLAGGVPGVKPDSTAVYRVKRGEGKGIKRATSAARGMAPGAKAVPGGILGFRTHMHQGGTAGFMQQESEDSKTKPKSARDAFFRGRNSGKIAPEMKMLSGLSRGHKAANGLLVGGAAATAYGLHERKKVSKSRRSSDTYNAALAGAGGTAAVATTAAPAFLDSKRKKYEASASRNVDEAGRLVPKIAGRKGKQLNMKQMERFKIKGGHQGKSFDQVPWPKTMHPSVSDSDIARKPHLLSNVPHHVANEAGKLRGAARQERHFAHVLGNTAKVTRKFRAPAAVAGAVGYGGLKATQHGEKKNVQKGLNPLAPLGMAPKDLKMVSRGKNFQRGLNHQTPTLFGGKAGRQAYREGQRTSPGTVVQQRVKRVSHA